MSSLPSTVAGDGSEDGVKRAAIIIGSLVLGALLVGGAYAVVAGRAPEEPQELAPRPVTRAELAAADGKDGRPCLVAVDGTVYQIDGFTLWRDGEHIPSEGQASCGADLSEVIRRAPHGLQKLELLDEVGPLEQ